MSHITFICLSVTIAICCIFSFFTKTKQNLFQSKASKFKVTRLKCGNFCRRQIPQGILWSPHCRQSICGTMGIMPIEFQPNMQHIICWPPHIELNHDLVACLKMGSVTDHRWLRVFCDSLLKSLCWKLWWVIDRLRSWFTLREAPFLGAQFI